MLIMKKRKPQKTGGIELPYKEKIRTLGEKENYKNFGILESDTIRQAEIKKLKRVSQENEIKTMADLWWDFRDFS